MSNFLPRFFPNSVPVPWTRSIGNFDPERPANANSARLIRLLGPRYQRKSVYKLTEAYIRAYTSRKPDLEPFCIEPDRINSDGLQFVAAKLDDLRRVECLFFKNEL